MVSGGRRGGSGARAGGRGDGFLRRIAAVAVLVGAAAVSPALAQSEPGADQPASDQIGRQLLEQPAAPFEPMDQREVDHLLNNVQDPGLSVDRRRRAAMILLQKNDDRALRQLRRQLVAPGDALTRRVIAQAIARTQAPGEHLIEPLMDLLGAEEEELRRDVAAALGRFDRPELIDELIGIAEDEQEPIIRRRGAVRALAEHRRQRVAGVLIELAGESDDSGIRQVAFDALRRLSGIELFGTDLERWRRWWQRSRELSPERWLRSVMRNLSLRNRDLSERVVSVEDRLVATYERLYNSMPDDRRIDVLTGLLGDPMRRLRLLALDLVNRRLLNAQPIGEALRTAMRQRLTDHSAEVRVAAAGLLENLADEEAAALAVELLPAETDHRVRGALLSLMARVPRAEAVAPALALMEEPELRKEAASVLLAAVEAELLDPEQERRVLELARRHLEEEAAPAGVMVRLVGRLGEPEADLALLRGCLDHEEEALRVAAAKAISGAGWPLSPLVERIGDEAVRPVTVSALSERGESVAAMEALLSLEVSGEEDRAACEEAMLAIAGRLGAEDLTTVDQMLAEEGGDRAELHERILLAAAGLPAEPGAGVDSSEGLAELLGDAEASGEGGDGGGEGAEPRRAEALLRLAAFYRRADELNRARVLYEHLAQRSDLGADHQHRLAIGRIRCALTMGQVSGAAELTSAALESEAAPPAAALLDPWREAVERHLGAGRRATAEQLLDRCETLLSERLEEGQRRRLAALRERLVEGAAAEPGDP